MRTVSLRNIDLRNGTYMGFWFDSIVSIPCLEGDVEFEVKDKLVGKGHDCYVHVLDGDVQVELKL